MALQAQVIRESSMSHRFKILDERLGDLWYRRDTLSDEEWHELYDLIVRILSAVSFSHYQDLDETPENCIHTFCADKVYWPMKQPQYQARRMHAGGLVDIYANYLLDLMRARRRSSQDHFIDPASGETEEDPCDLFERIGGKADEEDPLYDLGLARERILSAAQQFLKDTEEWVRLYLARHHCPDAESALPRARLAEDYEIASYHYKARQLGIAFPKGGFRNYEEFAKTDLGQWVTGLGVEVSSENQKAIDEVLQILCLAALNWYRKHHNDR
jgi:hypothetical protein